MITKRLEMNFRNQMGRTNRISVEDARDDLTQAEVQTAMQAVIDKNIFKKSGGEFVGIDSARIVTTETQDLIG